MPKPAIAKPGKPLAEIAIIGGTGLGGLLANAKQARVKTAFGEPSDTIAIGEWEGRTVAFLPRHGKGHTIPPHAVNYRANIAALAQLGVHAIIAPAAVGSLSERIHPGDFVLVDQFIDRSGRSATFYDGPQVAHASVAEPACPALRHLAAAALKHLKVRCHERGTYVCVSGPRFSTRAESRLFRQWGGDVVGMTAATEAFLAREAEICYLPVAAVTDYDTFKENAVSIQDVLARMKENGERLSKLIATMLPHIARAGERACGCKDAMKDAFIG